MTCMVVTKIKQIHINRSKNLQEIKKIKYIYQACLKTPIPGTVNTVLIFLNTTTI